MSTAIARIRTGNAIVFREATEIATRAIGGIEQPSLIIGVAIGLGAIHPSRAGVILIIPRGPTIGWEGTSCS
jgi:hypothetical protein